MKKTYLVLMTLGLALFMSSLGWAAMDWQIVYQTDFATNHGWQTNQANNYYLDSLAPGGSPAYYRRMITPASSEPTSCNPDNHTGEYAYHLLPGLQADVPWRLEYDILPVSSDWAGAASLSFTDPDMTIGGINPTYLTMMYGHDDSGYLMDLEWTDSEGNGGGVRLFHYTPGTWYENLLEWDPVKGEFFVLIKERGGVTPLVDKIVTSSDPGYNGGKWPTHFFNIDRLAMSTIGDYYPPGTGAIGISFIDNIVVSQVPEPATILLLGLGGLVLRRRRR